MESLALLVFVLVCAVYLCGPLAALCAVNRWNILAVILGAAAVWLGIYFFVTVYTAFKYLGLVSALMGLWALLRATGDLYR